MRTRSICAAFTALCFAAALLPGVACTPKAESNLPFDGTKEKPGAR